MSELLEKLYITLQNIEILRVSLRLQKRKETNTMELENNEEGNGKGNKKRITIIAVVVAAIIAVVVAAFLLLSPHEPEASSIKDAATTTQEQLDEEAMKSRLWVSVANTIYADSATDTCYATDKDGNKITVLDNREENSRDISYTVTLEDGTEIYQSEIIKPGDGIESPKLSQHLEPGTYSIIATAQGYDAESHNAAGGIVSSIKQGAARYAASALIAAGLIAGGAAAVAANPADAFALSPSTVAGQMSDGSGNTASTAVWLQADTDKLIVAAPTQINMIVQADGTMTGPSAAATQLKNGSAFGIHVSKIQTTAKNSFALESTAKANDSASVTITPGAGTAVNLADTLSGKAITSGTDWNMAKVGATGADINLATAGKLSNITKDLAANQQFAQIDWTFAAGNTK